MNKKVIKTLILTFLLFLTINVKASCDYYLESSGSEDIVSGETVDIKVLLKCDSEEIVTGGVSTIHYDAQIFDLVKKNYTIYDLSKSNLNVTPTSGTDHTNFDKSYVEFKYSISDGILEPNKVYEIFSYHFIVKNDAGTTVSSIYNLNTEDFITVKDKSDIKSRDNKFSYKVNYLNENAKLSTLKVTPGILSPNFDESIFEYYVTVESQETSISIVGECNGKGCNITNLGNHNLKYGLNVINVEVTNTKGKKNNYVLNITRADSRSGINTLKSLNLSSGVIKFSPTINEYELSVENEIDKITIDSLLSDEKAKYVDNYGNREVTLVEGLNKVLIKVVAENEKENIYILNITRKLSDDNTLKELYINDIPVTLETDTFQYTEHVPHNIKEPVVINAVPNNPNAKVKVSIYSALAVGDNDITITVTSQSGKKVQYLLDVYRDELVSSNANLHELRINGYDLGFLVDRKEYTLNIEKERELDFFIKTEDNKAKYEIIGNSDLVDGSIIKIKVTAEDKTENEYIINIIKVEDNSWIYIVIIVCILILAGIITAIIILNKKNKVKKIKEHIREVKEKELEEEKEETETKLDENAEELAKEALKKEITKNIEEENKESNIEESSNNDSNKTEN